MKKLNAAGYSLWISALVAGITGCHEDPFLPKSAIPFVCQLSQSVTIDEDLRDTTTYQYNSFGNVEKSTYRRWIKGQLMMSTEHVYVYTADHYLTSQVEQLINRDNSGRQTKQVNGYLYTYEEGRLRTVKIIDNTTNVTLGYRDYTYDGDRLKTYTETDANRAITKRYTYDDTGELSSCQAPGSVSSYTVNKGKIIAESHYGNPDSTDIRYQFDSRGQLEKQTIYSGLSRVQYSYTYDNNPYWYRTQLGLRGIPALDLGEHRPLHNLKTRTYQRYQNDRLLEEQTLVYSHAYNKNGYSLGYGRSDGARQINYYINCP
ncbi:hypothetical protein GGR92_003616 [Spirosoma lacussanchae]|uniref:hypothetical protein n=1 Tax=Spirosoma lacussanchae TaxID=1884249 RepID=UPI0011095F4F|nr:hypothetical protein [Spirosoma lacussanchae]